LPRVLIPTPAGDARVTWYSAGAAPKAVLVASHGAGGGVEARDLVALAESAADTGAGAPLIAAGRSAGARVACRTAADLGAAAVLAPAFPLHPPGRPEKSRADGLAAVRVPLLVVQGGPRSSPYLRRGDPMAVRRSSRPASRRARCRTRTTASRCRRRRPARTPGPYARPGGDREASRA
jgi:hypothetical protein